MAALPAMDQSQDAVIADAACKLLVSLPDDSKEGMELLYLIRDRFPNEAKAAFRSFVSDRNMARVCMMSSILCDGNPLAREILAPFLDDKREPPEYRESTRLCDLAAEAIFQTAKKDMQFDFDGDIKKRDEQIAKIKEFCKKNVR